MSGGVQTFINTQPSPAVAGDYASANPRASFLAGPGGLVAGASGVTIGAFAWVTYNAIDADAAPATVNNFGSGAVAGFVHREQQGLYTTVLADAGMSIPSGFPVIVQTAGDYWVKNSGANQVVPGMYAYATLSTGLATFAAGQSAASTVTAATSAIAASTFSVTGSISNNVLTVTNVSSGTIYPGATISGTGIASGTQIVSQLSGTAGAIGTYSVSIPEQTVASTTVSGTYGTLTLGATPSGQFPIGALLSGSGVAAGSYVTAYIAGSGSANGNTLVVNNNTVVASTTITATTNVATKWQAMSGAAAGELVKISSWPLN